MKKLLLFTLLALGAGQAAASNYSPVYHGDPGFNPMHYNPDIPVNRILPQPMKPSKAYLDCINSPSLAVIPGYCCSDKGYVNCLLNIENL